VALIYCEPNPRIIELVESLKTDPTYLVNILRSVHGIWKSHLPHPLNTGVVAYFKDSGIPGPTVRKLRAALKMDGLNRVSRRNIF